MVRIIKQPRWAFWRYEETYEFEVPSAPAGLIERIVSFYGRRGVRDLVREHMTVRFSRGAFFGSVFSPIERHHKQDVVVRVTEQDGACIL